MKVHCTDCAHFKDGVCAKSSKNGYFNCKKFKAVPIDVLTKEYKSLLVSKENPERLQELKSKLENINGGIL